MKIFNSITREYLRLRLLRLDYVANHPLEVQEKLWKKLVSRIPNTAWGKQHNYSSINSIEQYTQHVPITNYEILKPYIERMMHGESDVLWTGKVKWFAKSSGTTSDKSKFIPVTNENLYQCHIKGPRDTQILYRKNVPNTTVFDGKTIIMGGSHIPFAPHPQTRIGDVSAIMLAHLPPWAKLLFTPDIETALMSNWDEKIKRIAKLTINQNITQIGGVPTWTLVLFKHILEVTGKNNILEVWPNFQLYDHGGVSFDNYKSEFQRLLPSDKVAYMDVYNASEGFFAVQSDLVTDDMLLLLDNGIFYEFLPQEEWDKEQPQAVQLADVKLDKNYALMISTNAGLWRYLPGDTIKFTSKYPFKIKITGRMSQFINAFGEEVVIENTDAALAKASQTYGAVVNDYTVAPIYLTQNQKGGHEWLIEFEQQPQDIAAFKKALDLNLQAINSDYEAKRYKNMALNELTLRVLEKGTFHSWLRSKGKYGGQHKVPRLANHRKYVEEILNL